MNNLSINVRNLGEVRKYLNKVQKNIPTEIGTNAMNEISKSLQRMIKRRAPLGTTGWLRRSVMIENPTKNKRIVRINAYYAMAVEKGRKSNMIIPLQFIQQHFSLPEAPAHRVSNPVWINLANTRASQPRPFISPSLLALKDKIPSILDRYLKKTIQK
jgi:hypothetical protein